MSSTAPDRSAGLRVRLARDGVLPGILALLWIGLLVAGMGILWRYKETPGPRAEVPSTWPAASRLPVTPGRSTLLLFAHPGCPCTQASLSELRGLLPRYAGRTTACVAVLRPDDPPEGWSESKLLATLASMPEALFVSDQEGREAARFGVKTSGHVLLYGADGKLRFSGGICSARGHGGDNSNLEALERALQTALDAGSAAAIEHKPVFGCLLFESGPSAEDSQ